MEIKILYCPLCKRKMEVLKSVFDSQGFIMCNCSNILVDISIEEMNKGIWSEQK